MGKTIKVAICEWALPIKVQGPYCCRIAAEFGLDGIELDLGDYERGFPLSNPYIIESYKEERQKYNIEFPSIAVNALCKYGMTNRIDSEKGRIAAMAIKKSLETAVALNIPVIQLPSFEDGAINNEEDFQTTADHLRGICDAAKDTGIIVSTENVLPAEENLRLIKTVGRDNIRIFYDTQNPHGMAGQNVYKQIALLSKSICQIHVKDGKRNSLSSALLGLGESEFYKSMEELKKVDYDGWLILENYYDLGPFVLDDKDPFELLKEDMEILKTAISEYLQ